MSVVDRLSWEVLNATADDSESLEQIVPAVCHLVSEANVSAVAAAVSRLEESGLLGRRTAPGELDGEGWFHMTATGRAAWLAAADRYAPTPAD